MKNNSLNWIIEQNDCGATIRLIGSLSRDTLLPFWQQRSSFLSNAKIANQQLIWELSEINRIDTAGFALLCDFIYKYEKQVSAQKIHHAPTQLQILADLFGLSHWLNSFL